MQQPGDSEARLARAQQILEEILTNDPQVPYLELQLAAFRRIEELSRHYALDLWRQSGIIARGRGRTVQRTLPDADLADTQLRTGFRRTRKLGKVIWGLAAGLGGIGAAGGLRSLMAAERGTSAFLLGVVIFAVGTALLIAGIVLNAVLD